MKALMLTGKEIIKVVDLEKPEINSDEVLVNVKATGICGSDIKGYAGKNERIIPPMIMGHEFTGCISKIGKEVRGFNIGEKVVVLPLLFCDKCKYCKKGQTNLCSNKIFLGVLGINGSMAEYIAIPSKQLYRLPDKIDYITGTLIEPLSVAFSAVNKVSIDGKIVLIIGAGTIGLLILEILKKKRPLKILVTDIREHRLELAKKIGADLTINPLKENIAKAIEKNTDSNGIDISFEAVGTSDTAKQSIDLLNGKGISVWVGNSEKEVMVDMQEIVTKEKKIIGSFIYTHEEFGQVVELLNKSELDLSAFISNVLPLEEGPEAFKKVSADSSKSLKTILTS
jgi:2-desacetyl-2-hydroxyethyl bacteriochlorophyllide A dehydrogenase